MTNNQDLSVSNDLEIFSGFPCPDCASKRTQEIASLIVEDLGYSLESGTKFQCTDCGYQWIEWDSEWG